jgi:hypothetical protein
VHEVEALDVGLSSVPVSWMAEALLTTMSMPPNVSTARFTAACT